MGVCVYGPFRRSVPHEKCGNAAYTHTHIYTHRLFSFSKASSRALGMPEFGKIAANTRQIMHFWETLGASSRAKPPLGWPKTSCFPTFLATPAWAIGPKEPLIHLGRSWGGQKPGAFRHFWPPQRGHWPQGAPDPPWPPLGWPKTLCFYAFFANPVRPMAPKGSLGHLGRPWGGQKPCIFTRFWPTQCRPWAPRSP